MNRDEQDQKFYWVMSAFIALALPATVGAIFPLIANRNSRIYFRWKTDANISTFGAGYIVPFCFFFNFDGYDVCS